jgi:hypothetical protein
MLDPRVEDLVLPRALFHALTAFVRHLRGGFQQEETLLGSDSVEATTGEIVGERRVVPLRVVAAQRELEAVLAFRGSMASAGVAPGAREDRHHVPDEARVERLGDSAHLDREGDTLAFDLELERSGAVRLRESRDRARRS